MMLLAGATSDRAAYEAFCRSAQADDMCKTPPEFKGNLMTGGGELAARDKEYAAALKAERQLRRDPRVRAVFAIAPSLGPAFHREDLQRIRIPVAIVAGAADDNAPVATSAQYFAANIAGATLDILPGNVAHYVFLAECTTGGRRTMPLLCRDGAGVDRRAVHAKVAAMAVRFFDGALR
jgi:predicted dienelactone hydrolase